MSCLIYHFCRIHNIEPILWILQKSTVGGTAASFQVIKLSYCQNDSPMGGSFWQTWSIIYFLNYAYLEIKPRPVLNILLNNSGLQSEFKTFNVQFESRIWSSSVFFWSQFEHVEVETMYYKNVNKILLEFWVNRF